MVVAPLIANNYESRNDHAVVELFWHSVGSDAQQQSFERMSRRPDPRWISVMVNDVVPLELEHILEVEMIACPRPVEFERISKPTKVEFLRCQALAQRFASVAIFPKPRSRSSAVTRVKSSAPAVAAKKRSAGS